MEHSEHQTAVPGEVTRLLLACKPNDRPSIERLYSAIYAQLRALAGSLLNGERNDHTFQATALAHEAYLKLIDQRHVDWKNRAQFFSIAAQAMRRILVDHARARNRLKRRGRRTQLLLPDNPSCDTDRNFDLLAINEALERLAIKAPLDAQVVEMRFFAGLTEVEIAHVLGTTDRTVRRHWNYAKAWLYRELLTSDGRDDER